MTILTQSVYAVSPAFSSQTLFDDVFFAVGFSRQPLPNGRRFAIVTNTDAPGIRATDARLRCGLNLASLRPEVDESGLAKMPPAANFFSHAAHPRCRAAVQLRRESACRVQQNHKRGETRTIRCAFLRRGTSTRATS
jgi:hypothetical protein